MFFGTMTIFSAMFVAAAATAAARYFTPMTGQIDRGTFIDRRNSGAERMCGRSIAAFTKQMGFY
jgi:hypothetical protein